MKKILKDLVPMDAIREWFRDADLNSTYFDDDFEHGRLMASYDDDDNVLSVIITTEFVKATFEFQNFS